MIKIESTNTLWLFEIQCLYFIQWLSGLTLQYIQYFETPRDVSVGRDPAILFILHAYISSPVSTTVFHSNMKECQGNMEKCENTEWDVLQTGSDLQCSSSRQNGQTNPIDLY